MKKRLSILFILLLAFIFMACLTGCKKKTQPLGTEMPKETKELPQEKEVVEAKKEVAAPKKEAKKEEEPKPAGKMFSSPEITFNTCFLKAYQDKDFDLYMSCISKRSLEEIEKDPHTSISKNTSDWDAEPYRQANYKVSEKTDKYAIMVPQNRIIKGMPMHNLYFEKEAGFWKIDMLQTLKDVFMRLMQTPEMQEFINSWKQAFEEMAGE